MFIFHIKKSRINYPAFSDVPEGIRTPDRRLRRPLLYPAELQAHIQMSVPGPLAAHIGIPPTSTYFIRNTQLCQA